MLDEEAGTLTLGGQRRASWVCRKLSTRARVSNGAAIPDRRDSIRSRCWQVQTARAMTVYIESGAGVFWTFDLVKVSDSPLIGSWKLAGEGSFRVGPAALDGGWYSPDADTIAATKLV